MPAPPSSLIVPAIGHLVELAGDAVAEQPGLPPARVWINEPSATIETEVTPQKK
jgi:hypothetical protein